MAKKKIKPPLVGHYEETYELGKRMGWVPPKMRKEFASFKKRQKDD